MNRSSAWILFLLLCLGIRATQQTVWRYANYGVHSQQLLSYKNHVILECLSCQNVSWTSFTCSINSLSTNTNSSLAELTCSRPGFHQLGIEATSVENHTVQAALYVPLESTPGCYSWQAVVEVVTINSTSKILLQTWIGETASMEYFSLENQALTSQFHSLGEYPSVLPLNSSMELNVSSHYFNTSCSCWEFHIEADPQLYAVPIEIRGKGIVIMDCGIRFTQYLMTQKKYWNPALDTGVVASYMPSAYTKIYQDQEASGTFIILHHSNFITEDDFKSIWPFEITGLPSAIDEIVFTGATLCLLAAGEVFVLPVDGESIIQASGLPFSGIEHINGRMVSPPGAQTIADVIVAWMQMGEGLYISQDGGLSFQEVALPQSFTESVHSVGIHPSNMQISVLVSTGSAKARFMFYDLEAEAWSMESFSFDTHGGNLSLDYFLGVLGDLIVWEETALYYSPNGGYTVDTLYLYTLDSSGHLVPCEWVNGTSVKQVVTGIDGQFAVLGSTNRLFYGTIGAGYAVEVQSGVLPDSETVLVFSTLGELRMITVHSDGVNMQKVPTYSLVLNALYPPPACPYVQWKHNITKEVYYLDIGENLTLWASVTPREWRSNQLSFIVSEPECIESIGESHEQQTAVEGAAERSMTVLLQPTANSRSKRTAVKLSVADQNLSCPKPAEATTVVAIQCPPGRHIRVKRPDGGSKSCPAYKNLVYKIPRWYYDPELRGRRRVKGNVDKEVRYDYAAYGCPLKVPYSKSFMPTLELYDGKELIREVEADFVVWELHGRSDFGYSATAGKAKCTSTPQTWQQMLENGTYPSLAWTPETYRDCFQEGATLKKNTPYQILNSTGVSAITWRGHNGIYVMVATVVASDYSLCNLTTEFAVEVYGASDSSVIGYLMLVLTCIIGGAVLVGTYFTYRHLVKIGKLEKVE